MAMHGKTRINVAGLFTFELEPCCLSYMSEVGIMQAFSNDNNKIRKALFVNLRPLDRPM